MFSKKVSMVKVGKKGGNILIAKKGGKVGSMQAVLKQVIKDAYNKSPLEK